MEMGTTTRTRARWIGAMTLVAGVLGSQPARAVPPTTEDFLIYSYLTDEDGGRSRLMSAQDMLLFVNQARCECNQKIIARVTYQGSTAEPEQLNVYAGQNCATAQANGGIGRAAELGNACDPPVGVGVPFRPDLSRSRGFGGSGSRVGRARGHVQRARR